MELQQFVRVCMCRHTVGYKSAHRTITITDTMERTQSTNNDVMVSVLCVPTIGIHLSQTQRGGRVWKKLINVKRSLTT